MEGAIALLLGEIVLLLGAILFVLVAGRTAFLDALGTFFWIALACFVVYVIILVIRGMTEGFKERRASGEPWIYKVIGYPGVCLLLLHIFHFYIYGPFENPFLLLGLSFGLMILAGVVRVIEEVREDRIVAERERSTNATAKAFTEYPYTPMGRPEGERHSDDDHRIEPAFREALERYDKGDRQ
jgi:Na+-driven multidrug efflux pump